METQFSPDWSLRGFSPIYHGSSLDTFRATWHRLGNLDLTKNIYTSK
jgi:hypothetical protein